MHPVVAALRGGLVVSCQAYPGEPMRHPETMAQLAESAVTGGAVGIRAQGLADIALIRERIEAPVIGLWKDGTRGVFITPTLRHARAVCDAGADIVALDGTRRHRPDGLTLTQTVAALREHTSTPIMADCADLDDALAAEQAGVDVVGTTLAGYAGDRPAGDGPDLELVSLIAGRVRVPLIAEGRVHTPTQARQALDAGAYAVVVGTAITHPATITGWFVTAL